MVVVFSTEQVHENHYQYWQKATSFFCLFLFAIFFGGPHFFGGGGGGGAESDQRKGGGRFFNRFGCSKVWFSFRMACVGLWLLRGW